MCQYLRVDTWTTVSFWTNVSSPSFPKVNVPSTIQNEPQRRRRKKKKKFKPQGAKKCLTLNLMSFIVQMIAIYAVFILNGTIL
jgi:hypothetical protein